MSDRAHITTRRPSISITSHGRREPRTSDRPKCGEHEVAIPRIEDLHRTIAQAVIAKRERLTPAEIRFLRKFLGWSGADFAAHVGTTPETVSRSKTAAHQWVSPRTACSA